MLLVKSTLNKKDDKIYYMDITKYLLIRSNQNGANV